MKLRDVHETPGAVAVLWRLLEERPAVANISHRGMPTREQHEAFIASRPYKAWYLIEDAGRKVGAVYLTKNDEIGVFVLQGHQRRGYAKAAVTELMRRHPRGRYLANIAPANDRSAFLFGGLGFEHIQDTYEFRP